MSKEVPTWVVCFIESVREYGDNNYHNEWNFQDSPDEKWMREYVERLKQNKLVRQIWFYKAEVVEKFNREKKIKPAGAST